MFLVEDKSCCSNRHYAEVVNPFIQPTDLFDCNILPPLTATGGVGDVVYPSNTNNTSGLSEPMQYASLVQPSPSLIDAPVFVNESIADGEAVIEAATNYKIKYEEAAALPAVSSGMIDAEALEANAVAFDYGVGIRLTPSLALKNGTAPEGKLITCHHCPR